MSQGLFVGLNLFIRAGQGLCESVYLILVFYCPTGLPIFCLLQSANLNLWDGRGRWAALGPANGEGSGLAGPRLVAGLDGILAGSNAPSTACRRRQLGLLRRAGHWPPGSEVPPPPRPPPGTQASQAAAAGLGGAEVVGVLMIYPGQAPVTSSMMVMADLGGMATAQAPGYPQTPGHLGLDKTVSAVPS